MTSPKDYPDSVWIIPCFPDCPDAIWAIRRAGHSRQGRNRHVEMVPSLNDIDEKEPSGREPILGLILADRGPAKVGWAGCHHNVF